MGIGSRAEIWNTKINPNDPRSYSRVISLKDFYKYFDRFYITDLKRFEQARTLREGENGGLVIGDSAKANSVTPPPIPEVQLPKQVTPPPMPIEPKKQKAIKFENPSGEIHKSNQINALKAMIGSIDRIYSRFSYGEVSTLEDGLEEYFADLDLDSRRKILSRILKNKLSNLAGTFKINQDKLEAEGKANSTNENLKNSYTHKTDKDSDYQELTQKINFVINTISEKYMPIAPNSKRLKDYGNSRAKQAQQIQGIPFLSELGMLASEVNRLEEMSKLVGRGSYIKK